MDTLFNLFLPLKSNFSPIGKYNIWEFFVFFQIFPLKDEIISYKEILTCEKNVHLLLCIREILIERNEVNVRNMGRVFVKSQSMFNMREPVLVEKPTSVKMWREL